MSNGLEWLDALSLPGKPGTPGTLSNVAGVPDAQVDLISSDKDLQQKEHKEHREHRKKDEPKAIGAAGAAKTLRAREGQGDAEQAELLALVDGVTRHYACTPEEVEQVRRLALQDRVAALESFRAMTQGLRTA